MNAQQGTVYVSDSGIVFGNAYDCAAFELAGKLQALMISCGHMTPEARLGIAKLLLIYSEQVYKALGEYISKRDELAAMVKANTEENAI